VGIALCLRFQEYNATPMSINTTTAMDTPIAICAPANRLGFDLFPDAGFVADADAVVVDVDFAEPVAPLVVKRERSSCWNATVIG
jgi:hypothetical protein